jgi:DNA-binding GntR family transcriptional regulator
VVLPGTKLSETEVARRFGVSRQPLRSAFRKLANEELLFFRPQKAAVVRGFSMERN